jgi:hypothetical protein
MSKTATVHRDARAISGRHPRITNVKVCSPCGFVRGNFDQTHLDHLIWAGTYHPPGPLYEGNGTLQPFISDNSTPEQRQALLTIMSGKAGNAWFEVVASKC